MNDKSNQYYIRYPCHRNVIFIFLTIYAFQLFTSCYTFYGKCKNNTYNNYYLKMETTVLYIRNDKVFKCISILNRL